MLSHPKFDPPMFSRIERGILLPRQASPAAPARPAAPAPPVPETTPVGNSIGTAPSFSSSTTGPNASSASISSSDSVSRSGSNSDSSTQSGSSPSSNASGGSFSSIAASSQTSLTASEKANAKQSGTIIGITAAVCGVVFIGIMVGWAALCLKRRHRRKRYAQAENFELNDSTTRSGKEHIYEQVGVGAYTTYKASKKFKKDRNRSKIMFARDDDSDENDLESKTLLSNHYSDRPTTYDPFIQAALNSPQLDVNRKPSNRANDTDDLDEEDVESLTRRTESEHRRDLDKYDNALQAAKGMFSQYVEEFSVGNGFQII